MDAQEAPLQDSHAQANLGKKRTADVPLNRGYSSMTELEYSTFKALEGQRVNLGDANGQQVPMTVTTVKTFDMRSTQWFGWNVLLEADHPLSIAEGTYQISHSSLGNPLLHISAKSEVHYEIIVTGSRATG